MAIYSYAIRDKLNKFDREESDVYYLYAASAFTIALLFAGLAHVTAKSPEKKSLTRALFLIDIIPTGTYLLHAFRLTPAFRDVNGYPVDVARYIEWITTCPVLLLLIGEVTKNNHVCQMSVINDYLMLITGFLAAVTREPYSVVFAAISVGHFFVILSGLWEMYTAAIEGRTDSKVDKTTLYAARAASITSWTAFATIWFLVKYNFVTFFQGEVLYVFSDIIAKVYLTLIMVNSTVDQTQTERVDALSTIASAIQEELSNSDKLLEKMMPAEVIEQIKSGRATKAEDYESVTVFFSDITNFTVLSSQTATKDMLATLNALWLEYDAIAKRYGMYKVETIGDAYLGVVGCPERVQDHAVRAVDFALDIIAMIRTFKTAMGSSIQIRVGLNSGPITAGILGEQNPHWCVVGETVNIASKMESTSKPMHIHINEPTYELARKSGKFDFSEPEVLNVKGKGQLVTYFVNGRK